jgi:hypothetical protein
VRRAELDVVIGESTSVTRGSITGITWGTVNSSSASTLQLSSCSNLRNRLYAEPSVLLTPRVISTPSDGIELHRTHFIVFRKQGCWHFVSSMACLYSALDMRLLDHQQHVSMSQS